MSDATTEMVEDKDEVIRVLNRRLENADTMLRQALARLTRIDVASRVVESELRGRNKIEDTTLADILASSRIRRAR